MRRFLWDLFINTLALTCVFVVITVLFVGLIELAIRAGVICR